MFRQSIYLLILQVASVLIGAISVFYVAGAENSDSYAIVGVFNIISSISLIFTNTGIETYAIRNVLNWQSQGKFIEVKTVISQSIIYRLILSVIVLIPLYAYTNYLSNTKYYNDYDSLFITLSILTIFKNIHETLILLFKSFNKYLHSQLSNYFVNVFGKLIALYFYTTYGLNTYLIILSLLPIVGSIPLIIYIIKWIDVSLVFNKEYFRNSILNSKSFALSSYISYIYNYIDQIIVSLFLPSNILGSFTVCKSMYNIIKQSIENIFDPLTQSLVRFKHDSFNFNFHFKKISKLSFKLFILMIITSPIVIYYIDEIVVLLRLNQYTNIQNYLVYIYISQILFMIFKTKLDVINLFFNKIYYLKMSIFNSIVVLLSFVLVINLNTNLIFSHLIISNLIITIYVFTIYQKHKII